MGIMGAMCAWIWALAGCGQSTSSREAAQQDLQVHVDEVGTPWSYERLAALPKQTFAFDDGAYFKGQEVTVVRLADFWQAVAPSEDVDTLTAYCKDDYFSVYTRAFVDTYDPFIIIEVEGLLPTEWQDGLQNAAPYFISFAMKPEMPAYRDPTHKRPWGVESVTFGTYSELFSVLYEEPYIELSESAALGRDIWINSCSSCHQAPGNGIGGRKAARPWEILAVHAKLNKDYFRQYVRNPQAINPAAQMEAHPQYSDEELEALMDFLSTGG